MARREVIDCDACQAKSVGEPVRIHVAVGYRHCPAGGPAERNFEEVDLCHKCAARLLSAAVNRLDHMEAKKWVGKARSGS